MSKEINTTFLSIDNATERGFLHRDYIAHCFRWSHVIKFMQNKHQDSCILDLGCGKEVPLLKTLYTSKMTPKKYIGLDFTSINYNDCIKKASDKCKECIVVEHYDVSEDPSNYMQHTDINTVVSFEVFEHMTPRKLCRLLHRVSNIKNADLFFSTPNFNGKPAANHINEMTEEFLIHLFDAFGFELIKEYGTFASQKEYYPYLNEQEKEIFNKLHDYYDSNVLAVIFAPLYPKYSRNVLYRLKTTDKQYKLDDVKFVIESYYNTQQDKEGWKGVLQ